jgi:putative restriction endonuclease
MNVPTSSAEWYARLAKLRVDRARGQCAPHKPLLLLVLCDIVEQGLTAAPTIELTAEIASRFMSYWAIVAGRRNQKPDVRLPFHHLGGDGFWQPLDANGQHSSSREMTRSASVLPEFYEFIQDRQHRTEMRRVIIGTYFPALEQVALCEALDLSPPTSSELDAAMKGRIEAARLLGREARFRVSVLALYDYTCALTGYRLTTVTGASVVDAAHIHKFADSRNNDVQNGIALSKNAHWLFDQGLWTISDDYRIEVASQAFVERGGNPDFLLSRLHGHEILLPNDRDLWPSSTYLAWHRAEVFFGI